MKIPVKVKHKQIFSGAIKNVKMHGSMFSYEKNFKMFLNIEGKETEVGVSNDIDLVVLGDMVCTAYRKYKYGECAVKIGKIVENTVEWFDEQKLTKNTKVFGVQLTKLNDTSVIFTYHKQLKFNNGVSRVITVENNQFVIGEECVFNEWDTRYSSVSVLNKDQAVVVYNRNNSGIKTGSYKIGTISDNLIAWGEKTHFCNNDVWDVKVVTKENDVFIAYSDYKNLLFGFVKTGKFENNQIEMSENSHEFSSGCTLNTDLVILEKNRLAFVYRNNYNNNTCIVRTGKFDGSTFEWGVESVFGDESYNKMSIEKIDTNVYVAYSNDDKGHLSLIDV